MLVVSAIPGLLVSGVAWADDEPAADRVAETPEEAAPMDHDRVLGIAPAVPRAGTARVALRGGVEKADLGDTSHEGSGDQLTGSVVALAAVGRGIALEASASTRGTEVAPGAAVRWQWLRQDRAFVDVTSAIRYGSFGVERADARGGMVGVEIGVGRSFGRLALAASALVGRGVVDREDTDGTFAASALVCIADRWRLGLEGRARTELVDGYDTPEDHGRSAELTGGLVAVHRVGRVELQALGGAQSPRGLGAPGPVATLGASLDF